MLNALLRAPAVRGVRDLLLAPSTPSASSTRAARRCSLASRRPLRFSFRSAAVSRRPNIASRTLSVAVSCWGGIATIGRCRRAE